MLLERHGFHTMLNLLLNLVVISLSLAQLTKIGMIGQSRLYAFDLFVGILSIIGTFYFLSIIKKLKIAKFLLPFYIFSFIAGISLMPHVGKLTENELITALFYLFRWFLYLNAVNVVYNMILQQMLTREKLKQLLLTSGVIVSVAGFIQLLLLPDLSTLDASLGWDPHKSRLTSTFFDPNFVGGYLSLCLALILFDEKKFDWKKYKYSFLILLLGLFLTYSRSSWAMFGAITFIYGVVRSRLLILVSLIIAFSVYFAIPRIQTRLAGVTDPADSAHFRLISWKNTLDIAQDNLFLGVGFNSFKKSQIEYGFLTPDSEKEHSATGADSSFLLVLATTGIVGLLVFLIAYFYPISGGNLLIISSLLGLLIHAQFVNSLFYPQILFLWLNMLIFSKTK